MANNTKTKKRGRGMIITGWVFVIINALMLFQAIVAKAGLVEPTGTETASLLLGVIGAVLIWRGKSKQRDIL